MADFTKAFKGFQNLIDKTKGRKGFSPTSPLGHGVAKMQKAVNERNLDTLRDIHKDLAKGYARKNFRGKGAASGYDSILK